MYKLANSSRKAMQDKAKRLVTADPHQKVDSSTWSPAEPLDTEAKTGARPLVRRVYRSGGKVQGDMAKKRGDRAARKLGGRSAPWVDDLINRDVRTANEAREGKKHVGAFKKGGRTKHADGMKVPMPPVMPADIRAKRAAMTKAAQMEASDSAMKTIQNAKTFQMQKAQEEARRAAAQAAAQAEARRLYDLTGGMGKKKGGKVSEMEWEHSKEDLKQDKKLAKKHGMSLEKWEKSSMDKKHDKQQSAEGLCYGGKAKKADGGKVSWLKKSKGAETFSGNSTTKVPGVVGGRKAHAKGGKAKGKTNININIMPQAGGPSARPMPMMGMKPPMPPVMPPVAPPAGAPPMGGAGTDPALLAALAGGMKGGAPAPMGGGMPPMPRKSGGRTIHVINHASGGGLGRLEKVKAYGEAQKKLS